MRNWLKKISLPIIITVFAVVASGIGGIVQATAPGINQIVSNTSTGSPSNNSTGGGTIAANGRAAVFYSSATNILPSGGAGLFHKNLVDGALTRVDVSTSGVAANTSTGSTTSDISATGRYIVFTSNATNLIDGETISVTTPQLYLRDIISETTTLISKSTSGNISDGYTPYILGVSSDGRFIGFTTNASNLHPDSTDGTSHLYMLDRHEGSLSILDRRMDGTVGYTNNLWAPNGDMSCDGSMVVFTYGANLTGGQNSNHVDVYLLDRRGEHDRLSNLTAFADAAAMGPRISCNGDYVGFKSSATNIDPSIPVTFNFSSVWPFVYDRISGTYHLAAVTSSGVSISDTSSCGPHNPASAIQCVYVSDTGLALFKSSNSNLTGTIGTQAYVRDIHSGTTSLLSINSSGAPANGGVTVRGISADGSVVLVGSSATNLVTGDTNGKTDYFTLLTGN